VLKRAALIIKELGGGTIASDIVDVYPDPKEKTQVSMKYHYLKKLSGKNYHPDTVKDILLSLGFDIVKEGIDAIHVAAPFHKPDISLPADIVEEVMRIDGLDNIPIPSSITISPSVETGKSAAAWKEKVAGWLVGQGFYEILTNSITNSAYFTEAELETSVKMINNLSAELNILRPSLLETGLESIAWNQNRKNNSLSFFEFGKSYRTTGVGKYEEVNHLCLYVTGQLHPDSWKGKGEATDLYYLKGLCERVLAMLVTDAPVWEEGSHPKLSPGLNVRLKKDTVLHAGLVDAATLKRFDIRQSVYYADFNWDALVAAAEKVSIEFRELPRQLPVLRDLALVVDRGLPFEKVEMAIKGLKLEKLQELSLFDIFESEKLGVGKKSLAVSFTFLDEEKTLTDKEIDGMVGRIMGTLEKELGAEIRK